MFDIGAGTWPVRLSLRYDSDMTTDTQTHWETVYRNKAPDAVSWYRPHLETSLRLIEHAAPDRAATIIDIGGGESTLVDDLLARGYRDLSVLDISAAAIEVSKHRLGRAAEAVTWWVSDIAEAALPAHRYDVWHDRAVFHFFTTPEQRATYVRQVAHAVKPGGHIIISTFGPQGPEKCSGLPVMRYDAESLRRELGPRFQLVESSTEEHRTPSGATQQFMYCRCRIE